jgi:hypothetical protein
VGAEVGGKLSIRHYGVLALVLAALAGAVVLLTGSTSAEAQPTPTPLRITDVFPDGGSVGVPTDTRPSVTFDRRADFIRASRRKSFKLHKDGSKKAVPSHLAYYFNEERLELVPEDALEPNTTYKATIEGKGKNGIRSLEGGKLGGVDDPSATFEDGKVSWTFTTES